jgi:hypothetical protein
MSEETKAQVNESERSLPTGEIKLTPGNTIPKIERVAPDPESRQTGKEEPYAYIWTDKNLGELPVLNTANAWWLDQTKLHLLVAAYKFYATDEQASYYAGISYAQLLYFQKLHPDFYEIKHAAKQDPTLRAKQTIVTGIDKLDRPTAMWWLERIEKNTFSPRQEQTGAGGKDLNPALNDQKLVADKAIADYLENKEKNNGAIKPIPTITITQDTAGTGTVGQ